MAMRPLYTTNTHSGEHRDSIFDAASHAREVQHQMEVNMIRVNTQSSLQGVLAELKESLGLSPQVPSQRSVDSPPRVPQRDTQNHDAQESDGFLSSVIGMFSPLTSERAQLTSNRSAPEPVQLFGLSLEEAFQRERLQPANILRVPRLLQDMADKLFANGAERTEGIFRISAEADEVAAQRRACELAGNSSGLTTTDPHVLAALIKAWLRELREPLIPSSMYSECLRIGALPGLERRSRALALLESMPVPNKDVVEYMIGLLQRLVRPSTVRTTRMGAHNFGVVFAPCLLRAPSSAPLQLQMLNSNKEIAFVEELIGVVPPNPRLVFSPAELLAERGVVLMQAVVRGVLTRKDVARLRQSLNDASLIEESPIQPRKSIDNNSAANDDHFNAMRSPTTASSVSFDSEVVAKNPSASNDQFDDEVPVIEPAVSGLSKQPQPIAEEPQPMGEEPQPIGEEPQPIAEEPQPIGEEPQPIAEEPQPIGEEPQPIAEEPQPIGEEPQPIATEPQQVGEEPQPVTEEPQPVTEEPQPVTEEPQAITEEAQPVPEEPQSVPEEPQPIAEEPQPVTEEPEPIGEEPQPVTEEPQPVAEEAQPIITKGQTAGDHDSLPKETHSASTGIDDWEQPAVEPAVVAPKTRTLGNNSPKAAPHASATTTNGNGKPVKPVDGLKAKRTPTQRAATRDQRAATMPSNSKNSKPEPSAQHGLVRKFSTATQPTAHNIRRTTSTANKNSTNTMQPARATAQQRQSQESDYRHTTSAGGLSRLSQTQTASSALRGHNADVPATGVVRRNSRISAVTVPSDVQHDPHQIHRKYRSLRLVSRNSGENPHIESQNARHSGAAQDAEPTITEETPVGTTKPKEQGQQQQQPQQQQQEVAGGNQTKPSRRSIGHDGNVPSFMRATMSRAIAVTSVPSKYTDEPVQGTRTSSETVGGGMFEPPAPRRGASRQAVSALAHHTNTNTNTNTNSNTNGEPGVHPQGATVRRAPSATHQLTQPKFAKGRTPRFAKMTVSHRNSLEELKKKQTPTKRKVRSAAVHLKTVNPPSTLLPPLNFGPHIIPAVPYTHQDSVSTVDTSVASLMLVSPPNARDQRNQTVQPRYSSPIRAPLPDDNVLLDDDDLIGLTHSQVVQPLEPMEDAHHTQDLVSHGFVASELDFAQPHRTSSGSSPYIQPMGMSDDDVVAPLHDNVLSIMSPPASRPTKSKRIKTGSNLFATTESNNDDEMDALLRIHNADQQHPIMRQSKPARQSSSSSGNHRMFGSSFDALVEVDNELYSEHGDNQSDSGDDGNNLHERQYVARAPPAKDEPEITAQMPQQQGNDDLELLSPTAVPAQRISSRRTMAPVRTPSMPKTASFDPHETDIVSAGPATKNHAPTIRRRNPSLELVTGEDWS